MLSNEKIEQLLRTIKGYTNQELIWASGYLQGIADGGITSPSQVDKPTVKISVLYGTETGNSKKVAFDFAQKAKQHNIQAKVSSLDTYRLENITKESLCFFVISTHGEGDPPDAAKKFFAYIHDHELDLKKLRFAVLGLGDSSYTEFCKASEDVEKRLLALGASTLLPLQKCDVDIEEIANLWIDQCIHSLDQQGIPTTQSTTSATLPSHPKHTRKTYEGRILTHINLNDIGSNKSTYHIEIGCDEPIDYLPGDALAINPPNSTEEVDRILQILPIDQNLIIETAKGKKGLVRDLLVQELNIRHLTGSVIKKIQEIIHKDLNDIRYDLFDLIKTHQIKSPEELIEIVKILSPIAPRLYSISSAPSVSESEIHITVAKNTFTVGEEQHIGLCSGFVEKMKVGDSLQFHIQKNNIFRLPSEEKDIILIGPGTGIAPMRSFLQEREQTNASGKNWLFFGDQHFVTDFLYQTELQAWLEVGVLHQLSLAFSRDQEEKIYVQHEMRKYQKELYEWVEKGAVIYVCGDKERMSKDVENTWIHIIAEQSGKSIEDATLFIKQLQEDNRYLKDVY